MKVIVQFLDADIAGWAKFEEIVGLSSSNVPVDDDIQLIWKNVPIEKALKIVRTAYESPAFRMVAIVPEPTPSAAPGLKLVE